QRQQTNGRLSIPDENTMTKLIVDRLNTPIAQRLFTVFSKSVVKRCFEDQLRLKLEDFVTNNDLFIACVILQKQIDVINGNSENVVIPKQKLNDINQKQMVVVKKDRESYVPETKTESIEGTDACSIRMEPFCID
ncbi:unnamed protein product, partial [Didymodactylos carnosus]